MRAVTTTATRTLTISGVPGLDTITLFLQDFDLGQGRLVIECYGKAWASYWNAMSDRTLVTFVLSCNDDYLVRNLMQYRAHGMKRTDEAREEAYLRRILAEMRDCLTVMETSR